VDVVIPTVAEELVALAAVEAELREAGIVTWVPSPEAVTRCTDKLAFWHALAAAGVAAPATALGGQPAPPGPWVVKPRDGRGSRHVHLAETVEELDFYVARTPSPIVQTRIHGREFTADVLVDRDGTLAGGAARWRVETKAGISTKGTTFALAEVADACEGATGAVGLTGVANVQGFVTEDGDVVVVEINPRFSGALALSLHAGADLVGQYVRGARGLPIERDRLVAEPGVCMTRHFDEVFYRCA
jgi:carbamoyl-phosphate synthase large subunit